MKATVRITTSDLVKSLRSFLHGMADDVASGYRRDTERKAGERREEGMDDKRGT